MGFCGSDLHCYVDGGTDGSTCGRPLILGHEIAAEVIDDRGGGAGFPAGSLVAVDLRPLATHSHPILYRLFALSFGCETRSRC